MILVSSSVRLDAETLFSKWLPSYHFSRKIRCLFTFQFKTKEQKESLKSTILHEIEIYRSFLFASVLYVVVNIFSPLILLQEANGPEKKTAKNKSQLLLDYGKNMS